jgi:cell division initiation protein
VRVRQVFSTLALFSLPILVVGFAFGWFGLRLVNGADPPLITTTSTAMRSYVHPGDLVVLHDVGVNDLDIGDVVAFRDGEGDIAIRRITARDQAGTEVTYTLHADNRGDADDQRATFDAVIGTIGRRVPLAGWFLVLFRSVAGIVLLGAVVAFGYAGLLRLRFRPAPGDEDDDAPVAELAPVAAEPQTVTYGGGMSITPAELRHVRFAQVRKGYDTEAVDRALESVADSIEELLHERHELVERVRSLEGEVERYREVEATLSQTLTLAERAGEELKAEAAMESERMKVEAAKLLAEARAQMANAQQVAAQAAQQVPVAGGQSAMPDPAFIELLGETRAIRSLLQALLTQAPGANGGTPFAPRAQ